MKYIHKLHKMALDLTPRKSLQQKNPGKNWIREIREKSGSVISGIFDQILITVYKNGQIFEEQRFFLEIFTNFDVFEIANSPSKNNPILKSF